MCKTIPGILALLIGFIWLLSSSLLGGPYAEPTYPYEETESMLFDSLNARFIGNWPFGYTYCVGYDSLRNLAFLASGAGVYILDVSNPTNPVKISEDIHLRREVFHRIIYDSNTQRLYFSAGGWIEIWDVSDLYSPSRICMFSPYGTPPINGYFNICVSSQYAYCIDDSCFYVVDLSSPTNPQVIGTCDTGGFFAALKDSFALIVTSQSGLRVIDISDPHNPEEVSSAWTLFGPIFISGDYAYISAAPGLRIMDISDPHNCFPVAYYTSSYDIFKTHVIDTIAYCATTAGLRVLNVADPENVYEISSFTTGTEDVFATKSYAYLTFYKSGLKIIDVSNLSNPQLVGEFITPGNCRNISVSGSFAYIANEKGLYIIDVGDPQRPREVSHCILPHRPGDVVVSGSYAYVAVTDSGLRVVDVSNPCNPYVIGALNFPVPGWGGDCGLDISGHYCYLTANTLEDGLRVIDISNPAFPYQVGQCSLWCARDVAVSGLYAYVISDQRFSVIDISDPYNLNEVGFFCPFPSEPSGICVSGMSAFVVDSSLFYVFDIANPANPQLIFGIPIFDCCGIEVSGQYAYIVTIRDRLDIFDVSDPANPLYAGYYKSICSYKCNELSVQGTYAYVVSSRGLHIYQFYGAGVEEEPEAPLPIHVSLKLLQNPATGNSIKLMLTTSSSNNCAIGLYNVLGREVKAFNLKNLFVGKNYIDLSVEQIPNGIYFLRMNNGSRVGSEKVVILR